MSTLAAKDTSTLKALAIGGKMCRTCCTFAPSDCDCFSGDAWDYSTPYVEGDTVEHDGTYYNCQLANTNIEPPTATWWIDISPYGGPGGTPSQISIVVFGVIVYDPSIVRDPNGAHILDYNPGGGSIKCRWSKTIIAEPPLQALFFNVFSLNNFANATIGVPGTYPLFERDAVLVDCLLVQTVTNVYKVERNPAWGGTLKWRPGVCPAWDSGGYYGIGDCVGHEGEFYNCVAPHRNHEPPNILYWEVK